MRLLEVKPKNVEKTVSFLRSLQRKDGSYDSLKVAYYVVESLSHLGYRYDQPLNYFAKSLEKISEKIGEARVYADVTSEVEDLYYAVKILSSFNVKLNREMIAEQILKIRNGDGSFGRIGYSRLASTYYSLSILSILGYSPEEFMDTLNWIRGCEVPSGGFVGESNLSSSYMVLEDIYYGVMALKVLNEKCRYSKETLRLIRRFQNPNGGFRRSIFLGISDFESTYQAVSTIKTILAYHM